MRHTSMVAKIALLLAFALLVPVAPAQAQDEVVQVLHWWPDNPTSSFFPGKTASCVLGVRNVGVAPLNVTYALAHLASPYNASINIFNFTGSYLGDVPLAPGEETSAEYAIFFPKQLPPRDFVLQVSLVYSAGGAYQQKMFYNETISIVEEPTLFDTQLIGLYLIGLATLAGIAYFFAEFARGKGWIKKSKPAARPAAVSSNKEEWLRGTAADPRLRKKQ